MKKVLPGNAKIAKDSKEAIQECVSEFISFITSEASDKCQQEKRKTINGDDLLWAMSTLGFEKYIEPLKLYLGKYRGSVKGDKPEKKTTVAAAKKALKEQQQSMLNAQPKPPLRPLTDRGGVAVPTTDYAERFSPSGIHGGFSHGYSANVGSGIVSSISSSISSSSSSGNTVSDAGGQPVGAAATVTTTMTTAVEMPTPNMAADLVEPKEEEELSATSASIDSAFP